MDNLEFLQELEKNLPPIFSRGFVCRHLGGILSVGRLSNLDSAGLGPANRFYQGRTVCYRREDFLAWFAGRIKTPRRGRIGDQSQEQAEG